MLRSCSCCAGVIAGIVCYIFINGADYIINFVMAKMGYEVRNPEADPEFELELDNTMTAKHVDSDGSSSGGDEKLAALPVQVHFNAVAVLEQKHAALLLHCLYALNY